LTTLLDLLHEGSVFERVHRIYDTAVGVGVVLSLFVISGCEFDLFEERIAVGDRVSRRAVRGADAFQPVRTRRVEVAFFEMERQHQSPLRAGRKVRRMTGETRVDVS